MGLAFDPRPHRDTERNKPVADDCRCTRLTSLSLAEFKSFKILHDKVLDEMNKFYDIKGKARAFILQGGFVQFLFDVDLGLYGIDRNFLEVGLSLALDNGGYSSVLQTTFVPVSNGNAYFLADWYAPQGVVRNTAPYGSGRHSQDPEEPTKQYRRGNLAHAMAAMALATLKTGFKGIPDYGYVEDPLAQLRDAPHLEELALTSSTEGEIVFYSSSEDEDPGTTDSLLSGDRSVTRERATFAAVQSDPPKPTTRSMTRAAAAAAAGPSEPSGPSEEQQGGAVELEYEGDTEDDAEGHVYEQDGPDHDGMMDMD